MTRKVPLIATEVPNRSLVLLSLAKSLLCSRHCLGQVTDAFVVDIPDDSGGTRMSRSGWFVSACWHCPTGNNTVECVGAGVGSSNGGGRVMLRPGWPGWSFGIFPKIGRSNIDSAIAKKRQAAMQSRNKSFATSRRTCLVSNGGLLVLSRDGGKRGGLVSLRR